MRASVALLALPLLLAGCLGASPGALPPGPEAPAAPPPLPAAWMLEGLPAAPVPFPDLLAAVDALEASPFLMRTEEGRSVRGQPLVGLLFADGEPAGKPTVMFTGSQHGNEPSGSDAAVRLAAFLAGGHDEARALLGQLNVFVLLCANPDGRDADERGNAEEVDVNRDHMNLRTPEGRAIHAAYHRIDPDVVVDLHQFGGPPVDVPPTPVSGDIIFEVASVQNPLAHPNVIVASHQLEVAVVEGIQARFGVGSASTYPPTSSSQDSSIHRNHYGMHNSVSLLFEARRGLAEYATEVALQVVGAQAVLETVAADPATWTGARLGAEAEQPPPGLEAYLAPPQAGLENLTALLEGHGFAFTVAEAAFGATGVHYGTSAEAARTDFPAGTVVVPLAQTDWRAVVETFESGSFKDRSYTAGPRDLGLDVWREVEAPLP